METTFERYGAQSMTEPLVEVLVKRPGPAFGRAFDDPAHGFLHPVDLAIAQREHDRFTELLAGLGPIVHELEAESDSPDLVYQFDPVLVTDQGVVPLRAGKPNRQGEELVVEAWLNERGVPTVARIEAPGTIEGGDTFWLRPDLLCIGRSLRTNGEGARQLDAIVQGDVRVFDLPYWKGPTDLVHLLSVISPVADDLAVVYLPLLPVGLWELLGELGHRPRRGPGRGVPDPRLQRPGRRAGRGHHGRWQSPDRGGPRPGWLRGPHLRGDRDRVERFGRPDLSDPADPARGHRMTTHGRDPASPSTEPAFYSRPSLHVEIYDTLEAAVPGGDDIGFFRDLALRTEGPVLELGCGSGRVTVPLAEAGVTIVGVDRSRPMLDVAEKRRRGLPADVRRRLRFVEADMTDVRVGRRFGLVFAAFRVFMCLLDPDAQLAALATSRRHLRPGGLLALDLFDPRLDLLASEAWAARRMGEVRNPVTGRRVVVDVVERRNDLVAQRFSERWRFAELDDGGEVVREEHETLTMRWTFRPELHHLLARAGFDLVAEYERLRGLPACLRQRDHRRRPATGAGRLMAVADAGRAVAAAVDVERLTADLVELVRIPSVTGSEEAVADWLAIDARGHPRGERRPGRP